MATKIQHRRDTEANWLKADPVLMEGEIALVATNPSTPNVYDSYKVGGGSKKFSELPYQGLPCLQELGTSSVTPISQRTSADIALSRTPFTVEGCDSKDDDQTNAKNRSIWQNFFKEIEIPQDVLDKLFGETNYNPYPNENVFWSFAEGTWTPTSFSVRLYQNNGGWKKGMLVRFTPTDVQEYLQGSSDLVTFPVTVYGTPDILGMIYLTIDYSMWPSENVTSLTNQTLSSRLRPEVFKDNYYPGITSYKIGQKLISDYTKQLNKLYLVQDVISRPANGKMTLDWARRIIVSITIPKSFSLEDVSYLTPAQIIISSSRVYIGFYAVLSTGSWGPHFSIDYSMDDNTPNEVIGVNTPDGARVYINIKEVRAFIEETGGIASLEAGYKFEIPIDKVLRGYDTKKLVYENTPGVYQRPFLYKGEISDKRVSDLFIDCFYDIRYLGTQEENAHYGWAYVIFRVDDEGNCTGIYFENYSWKYNEEDGTPMFTSVGDHFTVPISVVDGDKLSYYVSPNGKYKMLVNWYRVFSLFEKYGKNTLIATYTNYEFSDVVMDKNSITPIDVYELLKSEEEEVLRYNKETLKISNGYIDNLFTPESMLKTYDYIEDSDFNTNFFSYGVWSLIEEDTILSRIEMCVSSSQNNDLEYKVKVFDERPAGKLDLWEDTYGTLLLQKDIIIGEDVVDDVLYINLEQKVLKGQCIIVFIKPKVAVAGAICKVRTIYYRKKGYTPIPGGTPFYWKSTFEAQNYLVSYITDDFAYYQMPLKLYYKYPMEERVSKLEREVNSLKINAGTQNPRLVIPKNLYAIVGKEFNLYYDAFTLLPEVGTNQNNILFDITCDIGVSIEKSFRVTPTESQVGNHPMTIFVLDTYGNIQYTASTNLIVVADNNPATQKRILMLGDSTTDDTAQVAIGLVNNLNDLKGGVKPILVGHKTYYNKEEVKHGAATGKTLSFYANGVTVLKFNVESGVPENAGNYPNLTLSLPDDSGYIVNIETTNNGDGSGSIIANVWTQGTTQIGAGFTGQLKTSGSAGWPTTIEVASTEQLNAWSPIRFDGGIDFTKYAEHIGLSSGEKIDLLSIDLGINDSRGTLQSESTQMNKINCAMAIAEAFHSYNSDGKVMFCLPKSCSAPRSRSNSHHDTYRMNIHRMRELYLEYFDGNSDRPYCYVCNSGLSIDRFWGYSLQEVSAAARYPDNKIRVNTEDVHPRTEGYYQVADAMVGCMIYLLSQ